LLAEDLPLGRSFGGQVGDSLDIDDLAAAQSRRERPVT